VYLYPFFVLGTRLKRLLKDPGPIVQEAGWGTGQGWSGWVGKILPLLRCESQTVQPVAHCNSNYTIPVSHGNCTLYCYFMDSHVIIVFFFSTLSTSGTKVNWVLF